MRFSALFVAAATLHLSASIAVPYDGSTFDYRALRSRAGTSVSGGARAGGDGSAGDGGARDGSNPNSGNQNNKPDGSAGAAGAAGAASAGDTPYVLSDADIATLKTNGNKAISANLAAIKANPRVDKAYPRVTDLYTGNSLDELNPVTFGLPDIHETLSLFDPSLSADSGWKHFEFEANGQTLSWIMGFVGKDQRSIMITDFYNSRNTVKNPLQPSEVMYQVVASAGSHPDALANIIIYSIKNPEALAVMRRVAQDQKGPNAPLDQLYTVKETDPDFDEIVGNYWAITNGLAVSKPGTYMLADHAQSLNGLRVTEVLFRPSLPSNTAWGAMNLRVGR